MLNSSNTRLIPGLIDKQVEFFVSQNEVKCLHDGQVYSFENIPDWITALIEQDILDHPEALKALAEWENLDAADRIRQYIFCRFGGLDHDADIDINQKINYTEYFDCGLRGQCRFEGRLCCALKVANGHLTRQEIEVLKRVQFADKVIAYELNISTETVSSHLQNIRNKTGLANKVELAVMATKKGII